LAEIASLAWQRAAQGVPAPAVDEELIAEITAAIELRRPNELALTTIAHRLADHYASERQEWFEGIVDAATGVGKTFIIASAIDYLSGSMGVRNFAVITPGRTILNKTVGNFTPGGRKSLTDSMATKLVVITAENFASPAMRAVMEDPDVAKLFVFTVQALTEPTSKASRRTRKFQEGLGKAFYDHLVGLDDLVVFADEHHVYYGRKFSRAIRGFHPFALIGLTATPHPDTPPEQLIFRYPLANAIADRLVKTPVLVGRMDDRNDPETKLRDGIALLEAKVEAVRRYSKATAVPPINPIMLVVCESIDQAKEVEGLLGSTAFFEGRHGGAVLRIDSEVPDASLAALADVEEPDSPVRIIVSVGMLKEGWDVANVYVIASLRPSISEILTEQTLGRGLRLPWGTYTDVELLDTLEILAHERYEELLAKAKALKEELIDWRTVPRPDRPEALVPAEMPIQAPRVAVPPGDELPGSAEVIGQLAEPNVRTASESGSASVGNLTLVPTLSRVHHARIAAAAVAKLVPRQNCSSIMVPILDMEPRASTFSLADITDVEPFRRLGRQLRLDPDDMLRRTLLSARTVIGRDGITRIELDTRPASETVHSQGVPLSPQQARPALIRRLALAPQVPTRAAELRAAEPLVDAFLDGLGDAIEHLGAYIDRAAGGLVELIAKAAAKKVENPEYRYVVRLQRFAPVRTPRPEQSSDRFGGFFPRVGYRDWVKAMHDENWFDSRPERAVANAIDVAEVVACWARLYRGDLPILWNGMGAWYHPDFLVVEHPAKGETAGLHWIIEVKSEKDLASSDVQAKKEQTERWAARVTADPVTRAKWRYLLLGEADITAAKGNWKAMRARYTGRT
jgi:type III restriction enzyme